MRVKLIAVLAVLLTAEAFANEQPIALKQAPGLDMVEHNCAACHSLDYIEMNSPFLDADAVPSLARPQPVPGFPLGGLGQGGSLSWNIVALLTLLTLLPAILLSMTPFVRLLVVFHFLRQALGTQSTPSNQTLIGLSLLLTFFLMQPVGTTIYNDAIEGMDEDASRRLIEELSEFSAQPKYMYRHEWEPHDVLMWDNRCTVHAVTPHDPAERRVMHRTTIVGREPVMAA